MVQVILGKHVEIRFLEGTVPNYCCQIGRAHV